MLFLVWAYRALFADAIRVTGAGGRSSNGGPQPLRYEINTFSQPSPAWDLYIQALRAIQSRPEVSCSFLLRDERAGH
jgi:hypothetical protein